MKKHYTRLLLVGLSLMLTAYVHSQSSLTGIVNDENNEAIIGATVILEGTQLGAVTDADGKYVIKNIPPKEYSIKVSYIGYRTTTESIDLRSSKSLNFSMKEDSKTLNDVVVVGYGTQRKRDLIGSVSTLTSEKLNDQVGASFETALQGKMAGVQLTQGSGAAGSNSIIRIRGVGSVSAGGYPLIIIDGVPLSQENYAQGSVGGQNKNPLSSLNPNDIESVTVLKDAASAAIYGSRGGNGVILITTKRGKEGKGRLSYSARLGISRPSNVLRVLNATEWLQIQQEAWENDGNVGKYKLPLNLSYDDIKGINTDWISKTIQTGIKHEHDLSYSFGNKTIKAYVGGSYSNAESFLVGDYFERLSGKANVDIRLSNKLNVSISSSISRGYNHRAFQAWSGGLGLAQSNALPIYPVYKNQFPKTSPFYDSTAAFFNVDQNPVAQAQLNNFVTRELRYINSASINFQATRDLSFTLQANYDRSVLSDFMGYDGSQKANTASTSSESDTRINNYSSFLTGQYIVPIANKAHSLKVFGGIEYQAQYAQNRYYTFTGTDKLILNDPELTRLISDTTTWNDNAEQIWKFAGIFGRINYSFENKYLVQFTLRSDGSSRFGQNKRFGYFPSIGLGYIMSEEPWFHKNGTVNYFKLKASWGQTGNSNIRGQEQWSTFTYVKPGQSNDVLSYNGQSILFQQKLANPDLQWEVASTVEGGFDIGLFNDRITSSLTYYNKLTTKALLLIAIQASSGIETLNFYSNVGKIRNWGLEYELNCNNIKKKDFSWTTSLNLAYNKNKLLDVGTATPDALDGGFGDIRAILGAEVGTNYLVRFSHVDAASGRPVWLDKNGKETFVYNVADDRVAAGNVSPDVVGGITNSFQFKNWDFSFLFSFVIGGKIYDDAAKRQLGVITDDWNYFPDVFNRWRQSGDNASLPRLTRTMLNWGGNDNPYQNNSTLWLYDDSFLRLRNLTLGYNFKLNSKFIHSLRAYVTGTNLFVLTKYRGWDPEVARDRENEQQRNIGGTNVTYLTPPQETTYMFGINVEF